MTHLSAQEWGREQARRAPEWSEDRWHRISVILGVDLIDGTVADPRPRRIALESPDATEGLDVRPPR